MESKILATLIIDTNEDGVNSVRIDYSADFLEENSLMERVELIEQAIDALSVDADVDFEDEDFSDEDCA